MMIVDSNKVYFVPPGTTRLNGPTNVIRKARYNALNQCSVL